MIWLAADLPALVTVAPSGFEVVVMAWMAAGDGAVGALVSSWRGEL
jgi:hypothetical protein